MNTFVTIAGWLCLLLICIALVAFAVALAADLCRRALERFEWAIADKTRHELGRSIASSSHWFSESDEAWTAIKVLGDHLTQGRGADVVQWREEWRRRLRKEAES